jgi:hypothetical protein
MREDIVGDFETQIGAATTAGQDTRPKWKRRGLIAGAAALLAATTARLTSAPPAEAGHGSGTDTNALHLGQNNTNGTSSTTTLAAGGGGTDGALKVTNSNGRGIVAEGSSNYHGMLGTTSGSAAGVRGESPLYGVQGVGNAANAAGVYGEASASGANGVYGNANMSNGSGVIGNCGPTGTYGVFAINQNTSGAALFASGNSSVGVYGATTTGYGVVGTSLGTGLAGLFNGNIYIGGNYTATGTKSAAVPHPDGTRRMLYCTEAPEPHFEDFGSAQLSGGQANVAIEPVFGALIQTNGYFVQLTPEGDCRGLYVTSKTSSGFTVRELQGGTSNVPFTYRIIAKRKDVTVARLGVHTPPSMPTGFFDPTTGTVVDLGTPATPGTVQPGGTLAPSTPTSQPTGAPTATSTATPGVPTGIPSPSPSGTPTPTRTPTTSPPGSPTPAP